MSWTPPASAGLVQAHHGAVKPQGRPGWECRIHYHGMDKPSSAPPWDRQSTWHLVRSRDGRTHLVRSMVVRTRGHVSSRTLFVSWWCGRGATCRPTPCLSHGSADEESRVIPCLVRPMVVRTRVTWQHGSRPCYPGTVERAIFAIAVTRTPFLLMPLQLVPFRPNFHSLRPVPPPAWSALCPNRADALSNSKI